MTAITEDLGVDATRVRRGGGDLWLAPFDSTKDPRQPHATVATAAAIAAESLACTYAPASGVLHTAVAGFGSSGGIDVGIFRTSPEENVAFTALAANAFNISGDPLAAAAAVGDIVKLHAAGDYALSDWKNIGEIGGTRLTMSQTVNKKFNEKNEQVQSFAGPLEHGINTIMLQSGKPEIDWLTKAVPASPYFALKYAVPLESGGHQIFIYPYVRVLLNLDMGFTGDSDRDLAIQIEPLKNGTWEVFEVWEG